LVGTFARSGRCEDCRFAVHLLRVVLQVCGMVLGCQLHECSAACDHSMAYVLGLPRGINVLGKRAGQASEPVKILHILPSTINYTSNIEDIETKQIAL